MALVNAEANQLRIKGSNWQKITDKARLEYVNLQTILSQHSSIQTSSIVPIPESRKQKPKGLVSVSDTVGPGVNLNDLLFQLFIGNEHILEPAKRLYRVAMTVVTQEKSIVTTGGMFYRDATSHSVIKTLDAMERETTKKLFEKYFNWMELLLSGDALLVSDQDVGALLNVLNVPTTIEERVVSDSRYIITDVRFPEGHVSTTIDANLLRNQIQDIPIFAFISDILTDGFSFGSHKQHLDVMRLLIIYGFRNWFQNSGTANSGVQIGALSTFNRQNAYRNGDDGDIDSKGRLLSSLFLTALKPDTLLEMVRDSGGDGDLDEVIDQHLVELMGKIGKLTNTTTTKMTQQALDAMFNGIYRLDQFGGKAIYDGMRVASKQKIRFSNLTSLEYSKVANLVLTETGAGTLPSSDPPDPDIKSYYSRNREAVINIVANDTLTVEELTTLLGGKLLNTNQGVNKIFANMLKPSNTVMLVDSSTVSFPALINQCVSQEGIDRLPKNAKVDIPTLIRTNWDVAAETVSNLKLSDNTAEGIYDYSKLFKAKPFTAYDIKKNPIQLSEFGLTWYTDSGVRQVALADKVIGADILMSEMMAIKWRLPSEIPPSKSMIELMKEDMKSKVPTLPTILVEGGIPFTWDQFATIAEHDNWKNGDITEAWKGKSGIISDHINNIFEVKVPMLSKNKMDTIGAYFETIIRDKDGNYQKTVDYNILRHINFGTSQVEGGDTFIRFINSEPGILEGEKGYYARNIFAYFMGIDDDEIPLDKDIKNLAPSEIRTVIAGDNVKINTNSGVLILREFLKRGLVDDKFPDS